MLGMTILVLLVISFAVICVRIVLPADGYLTSQRVLTCPETGQPAKVKVDVGYRLRTLFGGHERLRLQSCSRWPERRICGQECLLQVNLNPEILERVVGTWYDGKNCALCSQKLQEQDWRRGRFSAVDAEGRFCCGGEMPLRDLPRALANYRPVCWSCHVEQREHKTREATFKGDRRAYHEEPWTG
jgi:hypothetical protein